MLFISHDLGTVLEMADRVMVMYGGEIVEDRRAADMLREPRHPYSRGLLGSYADPRLPDVRVSYIPGRPPDLSRPHTGCLFAARCPHVEDACRTTHPDLLPDRHGLVRCLVAQSDRLPVVTLGSADAAATLGSHFPATGTLDRPADAAEAAPVLTVTGVSKRYTTRRGLRTSSVEAVRDVSFALRPGVVTALVGQSGSGKSTLARIVTAVERPTSGEVRFTGGDGTDVRVDRLRARPCATTAATCRWCSRTRSAR